MVGNWPSPQEDALTEVRSIDGTPRDVAMPEALVELIAPIGDTMHVAIARELAIVAIGNLVGDLAATIEDGIFNDLQELGRWWPETDLFSDRSGPELLRSMADRYYERGGHERDTLAAVLVCMMRLLPVWHPHYAQGPAPHPTTLWKVLAHFSVISTVHRHYCGVEQNDRHLLAAMSRVYQALTP